MLSSATVRKYARGSGMLRREAVTELAQEVERLRRQVKPPFNPIPPIEVVDLETEPVAVAQGDSQVLELAGKIVAAALAYGNVPEDGEDDVIEQAFRVARKMVVRSAGPRL